MQNAFSVAALPDEYLILHYGRTPEVHAASVVLVPGKVLALSGPNGSGKSTLFSQFRPAPQGLMVAEMVVVGRHPNRRRFTGLTDEDRRAVAHAMTVTRVVDMAVRAVGELSGGEMQRVWIAAFLAQEAGVGLLDEPTNHLDLRHQIETLDLVRDLYRAAAGLYQGAGDYVAAHANSAHGRWLR